MDSIRSVLKTTEELVTQARLNQIAREHRSIGSILDDREIFSLEDPRKNGKFDADKKFNFRRSIKTEIELNEQIDNVRVELPDNKGVAVDINTNDYEIEKGIWKTLSSEKEYFAKMNHQNPELQELRDNLKGKEKEIFKENIKKAIINLAEKFREECRALKRDLDSNGVFHPDANAHRVHCLYRLKLYKNLHCYSIEYPILKAIHEEKLRIAREEKRKAELLARFEQSGHWPISMHDKESSSSSSGGGEGLLASTSGNIGSNGDSAGALDPNTGKSNAAKRGSKASLGVRFTDDNRSLSTESTTAKSSTTSNTKNKVAGGSTASKSKSIPPGHKLKPITGGSGLPTIEDDADDSSNESSKNMPTKASAAGNTIGAFSTQPGIAGSTDRVFQRIKRGKLGGADPRGLLPEEAARLDKGEVSVVRKNRDKNDLLESQVSSWMLSSLQESQIAKTALGGAGAIVPVPIPTSLGSNKNSPAAPAVGSQLSPMVQSFAQSFNVTDPNMVSNDPFSPKKLLNFDQFYQMFDEYRTLATTATAQTNTVNMAHTPMSLYNGFSNSSSSLSPLRSLKAASSPASADTKKKTTVFEGGADFADGNDPAMATSASAAALNADAMRPATLNIVKHLSDIDPQFAAYLKIAGYHKSNERTMAKLNGKMTKPKKARKLNLLGKDAVNLLTASSKSIRSSRKLHNVTTQGFVNFFQVSSLGEDGDGGTGDEEAEEKQQSDDLVGAHSDDILTRLRKLEEDDLTHVSDEENGQRRAWKDNRMSKGGVLESDGADSADMSSVFSSQGSASTFTRAGSKSRLRQRNVAAVGGSGSNTQQDIQSKLTTVWDSLLLSATSRLAFMRKYSQLSHCRFMCKAVDMWAETTVFLLSLVEMLAVEKKIKDGSYKASAFTSKALHSSFKKRVPQLLASSAESLIPISMQRAAYLKDAGNGEALSQNSSAQEAPLSAIAIVKVKFAIERVLSSAKGTEIVSSLPGLPEREQVTPSLRLIHMIIDELLPELSNSLLRAQQELDDNIPYKNKTCKEWMLELALRERET